MKTIILLVISCLPLATAAQFTRGNRYISGSVSFDMSRNSDGIESYTRYSSISIGPSIGFLVRDNVAIGSSFSINHRNYKDNSASSYFSTSRSIDLGFFVQRFFVINDHFLIYGSTGPAYFRTVNKATASNYDSKSKRAGFRAGLSVGLVFRPSDRIAVAGNMGLLSFSHSEGLSDDSSSNSFGFYYGGPSFSIMYFLK